MNALVEEFRKALYESLTQTRSRITGVRYGPLTYEPLFRGSVGTEDRIFFEIDGEPHLGILRGRNRDLILTGDAEMDAAIVLRVMLDGDYDPLTSDQD
jgi:hypothetical protein